MCMTCGCHLPTNDHNDPANLTLDKFVEAAETAGITVDECIQNVVDTYADIRDGAMRLTPKD